MNAGPKDAWVADRLARWRDARDREALGELLKWQRDRAYAVACRVAGEADAEDAVQQACLKLLSRTHGFEDEERFRASMLRAVVQCALNLARARKTRAGLERNAMTKPAPHASALEIAEERETVKLVRQELARLPEDERVVLALCVQEGMSVVAAAEALAVPRETLRYRLSEALSTLRRRLKGRGLPLTFVALAGLLHGNSAHAAPASLCQALDAALTGAPCASISAASPAVAAPDAIVAGAGLATSTLAPAMATAAAVLLALGVAAAALLTPEPLPKQAQAEAKVEVTPAVAPPLAGKTVEIRPEPKSHRLHARKENVEELQHEPQPEEPQEDDHVTQHAKKLLLGSTLAASLLYAPSMAAEGDPPIKPVKEGKDKEGKEKEAHGPQEIPLAEVPEAIRAAAEAMVPGIQLSKVSHHNNKPGVTYILEGTSGEKKFSLRFTAMEASAKDPNKGDGEKPPKKGPPDGEGKKEGEGKKGGEKDPAKKEPKKGEEGGEK